VGVAYTQALLDRASAYVGQPLSARRYDEGLTELTSLYTAVTGQAVGKCRQCQYSDYLAAVQAYIRQATRELHPETMADSNYTLAPGFENETFVHEAYGKAVTAENLTDADAKFFIGKGFKDAFILKASQKGGAEGGASTETTEVEHKNPVVPQADLEKEQKAHQVTVKKLETEKEAHAATKNKAAETLRAEKEAHKATKNEATTMASKLADTEKQLAVAQAKIEELSKPTAPPTDEAGAAD